ncbi:MAG TPA: hypothetical protein PK459_03590, partial [Anaerolineaceae bacterium]|nr:hypothetical protein [Anaerolineaceae bacterium]
GNLIMTLNAPSTNISSQLFVNDTLKQGVACLFTNTSAKVAENILNYYVLFARQISQRNVPLVQIMTANV